MIHATRGTIVINGQIINTVTDIHVALAPPTDADIERLRAINDGWEAMRSLKMTFPVVWSWRRSPMMWRKIRRMQHMYRNN